MLLANFNFGGDYACSSGQLVYVLSLGGNPGLPNGGTNPAIALMSPVGLCPPGQTNFDSTPTYIFINELSTVASAYALAGFMTDATHLGYGSSNVAQQGLANAFLNINNLVSLETGVSLAQTPTGGDTPQTALDTLADILVPCVNSDGTSDCSSLFANAPSPAGVAPTDTLAAILNIAHNPSANVANLFGNGVSTQPFQPTLTAAPNDWTLAFTFYADYMVGPYFPAIDSVGNVWVPNYANNASPSSAPLELLSRAQVQPASLAAASTSPSLSPSTTRTTPGSLTTDLSTPPLSLNSPLAAPLPSLHRMPAPLIASSPLSTPSRTSGSRAPTAPPSSSLRALSSRCTPPLRPTPASPSTALAPHGLSASPAACTALGFPLRSP